MKTIIIAPANVSMMPYLETYLKFIKELKIDYELIVWDRLNLEIEEANKIIYKDGKNSFNRGFIDYFNFQYYCRKEVKRINPAKIIIFTIQMAFFMNRFLIRNFKGQYIFDIRDYHPLRKFVNINKFITCSRYTVISSEGYKKWLPKSAGRLIVNHNTNLDVLVDIDKSSYDSSKINISYIGSLVNLDENISLINEFANNHKIHLSFIGRGTINEQLIKHISDNDIYNVTIIDFYKKDEEKKYYLQSDFTNLLLNDDINSSTCMANRFYNSLIYGKPIIIYSGSHMADIVDKFSLGIVIEDIKQLESKMIDFYINKNVYNNFDKGRRVFFEKVVKENITFSKKIKIFLQE